MLNQVCEGEGLRVVQDLVGRGWKVQGEGLGKEMRLRVGRNKRVRMVRNQGLGRGGNQGWGEGGIRERGL